MRWYPKKEYLALSPRSESYIYEGAPWLICCLQATDGAMDMVAGFPFADPEQAEYDDHKEPEFESAYDMIRKIGIDEMIARAERVKEDEYFD